MKHKQLEIDIERMTSEGFSKEDIAKHVVDARNQQKVTARANTLEFNNLTDTQKRILKHWVKNTIDKNIADEAVK